MKRKLLRIVLSTAAVTIAATFNFTLFTDGFIVSLSVVILPILLYLNMDINALQICWFIALISPLFRWLLLIGSNAPYQALLMVLPDAVFYIVYGLLFLLFYQNYENKSINHLVIVALLCDFLSNTSEMAARVGLAGLTYDKLSLLFLIAFLRAFMFTAVLVSIKYYKAFLTEESHEVRYRNLLAMASTFKSEIYFMNKNMDRIEAVTQRTFGAYKRIKEKNDDLELQDMLLETAKDIHEIKKDYVRVIQGIGQLFPQYLEMKEMYLSEILSILILNTKEQLLSEQRDLTIEYNCEGDVLVKSHFLLMSVLGNMIQNAVEAIDDQTKGLVKISITSDQVTTRILLKDNGRGVEDQFKGHIFQHGFSTKFNDVTGDMNRGVGLSVVKSIVEEHFGGTITFTSRENAGTEFAIILPRIALEGVRDEILYSG